MDEFSLSGDSISISGRYVEILAEDWSEMDSTQRQSAAVKAYNQTISIRHHLHFKVFVAIFGVVCFMIAFQSSSFFISFNLKFNFKSKLKEEIININISIY